VATLHANHINKPVLTEHHGVSIASDGFP